MDITKEKRTYRAPRRLLHQRERGESVRRVAGIPVCGVARGGGGVRLRGRERRRCGSWRQARMAGTWPGTSWGGCGNIVRDYSPGWSIGLWNPRKRGNDWQRQKLAEFGNKVRWVKSLAGLTGSTSPEPPGSRPAGLRGIVFSNELLDAMPVHRLGWDAKERAWFEWGVTLRAGRFVWSRIPHGATGRSQHEPSAALRAFPFPDCSLPTNCWMRCPTGLRSSFVRRRSNGGARRPWLWDAASCLRLIMG